MTGPRPDRDALILQYRSFAVALADGVLRRYRLPEHLAPYAHSDAMIGLITAVDRWDPERGKLSTFLYRHVWGAVVDGIRANGHLSRRQREHAATARDTDTGLRFVFPDLAPLSLDVLLEGGDGNGPSLADRLGQDDPGIDEVDERLLADQVWVTARMVLNPRQREVLNARRYGVTQREISARLGVTESRINQIERAACKAVAAALGVRAA